MRRELGFEVSDRTQIVMHTRLRVKTCYAKYQKYIAHEVYTNEFKSWFLAASASPRF